MIEPLLSGAPSVEAILADDIEYVRDLGLVRIGGHIAITNPIYREVIPRELTLPVEVPPMHDPASHVPVGVG